MSNGFVLLYSLSLVTKIANMKPTSAKYDIVFWDLDGTLSNSKEGIFNAIFYACDKEGVSHPNEEVLNSFIGPPLYVSFMKHFYPKDEAKARQMVDYYREYYSSKGIYENSLYPGILEIVQDLHDLKVPQYLVTAKPTPYAKIVLEHSKIDHIIKEVHGSNMDGSRSGKKEIIRDIFKVNPSLKKKKIVMIGDRYYDIVGGKHHKLKTIAVLYGFGSEDELYEHLPNFTAANDTQLRQLLF